MRLVLYRGKWHAYERGPKGARRHSLGTSDRAAAERSLRDLEASLRRKATTVAEMYDDYLADHGERLASRETITFAWRRLKPVFGHLRPDQINRALTRAYATKEQRRGVGNAQIRRDLGILGTAIRYSDKAAAPVIELPRAPAPRDRYLTREEYRSLRDVSQKVPHLYVFVWLAYRTGGRATAILELTWDRVDFRRGQIRLSTAQERAKGRATVPMLPDLAEVLQEARRGALTDHVVEYGGKPVASIKKAFKAAAARAGLEDVSPHVLRHSAAVHMAEAGISIHEIAEYLGHSNIATTYKVYARFSAGYLQKAAGALE